MRKLLVLALVIAAGSSRAADTPLTLYIGTYATKPGEGIQRLELDPNTGQLAACGLACEAVRPSFLALSPDRKHLYSVSEVSGQPAVAAFALQPDGALKELNRQPTGGGGPCHVAADPTGKCLLVANYGGGSVNAFPINADGSLNKSSAFVQHQGGTKVVAGRQDGPHAHSVTLDPTGRFVVVADLGLDRLIIYQLTATSGAFTKHSEVNVGPGTGPRHFAFHPNGKVGFSINELSSTLTSYRYADGKLTIIEAKSTLPEGFKGNNTTAEVRVHPNGKFVYASNRGHDSIACFAVDANSGALKPLGHTPTQGKTPRNFNIDPTGRFLIAANQGSNNVVAFQISVETGALTPTGSTVNVPTPVCVLFVP